MVFFSENQTYDSDEDESCDERKSVEDESRLKYSENFLLNTKWKM